jgi:hypothetical protein
VEYRQVTECENPDHFHSRLDKKATILFELTTESRDDAEEQVTFQGIARIAFFATTGETCSQNWRGIPAQMVALVLFILARSKVTVRMEAVFADSIEYGILCDSKAGVQSWNDDITTLLPRNSVAFSGTRVPIAHLRTSWFTEDVETVLIPYSLHTISCFDLNESNQLEYLVFECGSELQSISALGFALARLRSLFIPRTLRFICPWAFSRYTCIACIHFANRSALDQLGPWIFFGLSQICAITIPSSVRRIDEDAFADCCLLRVVQFELPSECWCIATTAFDYCSVLEPISLPSSVEFSDCERFDPVRDRFPFFVNSQNFFFQNDCVVRSNGREVIRYLGSSQTFCVNHEITVLAPWRFSDQSSLTTLSFECPSRITHMLHHSFHNCSGVRFVAIPRSVRFIGEQCFSGCTSLGEVVFESPAAV